MFALVYIFGFGIQYLCVFMDMHYSVFVFDLVYLFLEQYLCVHMDLLYTVQYSCVWFGIFVLVSLCPYGYTVQYSCVWFCIFVSAVPVLRANMEKRLIIAGKEPVLQKVKKYIR